MEGGLGIRDLHRVQFSLAAKALWNIIHGSSLWSNYARRRFIKSHFADCTQPFPAGMPTAVFKQAKDLITSNCRWIVGNGDSIDFLRDNWTGNGSLLSLAPNYDNSGLRGLPLASVREVIQDPHHPARDRICSDFHIPNTHFSREADICV